MVGLLSLVLLMACGPGRDDKPPGDKSTETSDSTPYTDTDTDTSVVTTPPLELFEEWAEANGFVVQYGYYSFSTYENCCDPGNSCHGNNPSTPYGTWALPPAPDQTFADTDVFDSFGDLPVSGVSRHFRLRPDEAVVWIGTTPPEVKYFSMRSYVAVTWDPVANRAVPRSGSLGASLNNQVIATHRGTEDIFGQPLVVVTTSDGGVEALVEEGLRASGFAPEHMERDRITPSVLDLGVDRLSSTLFSLTRAAVPADRTAYEAWMADPGATLLRLSPKSFDATSPHPDPVLPTRGSGTNEDAWLAARDELEAAILDRYGHLDTVPVPIEPYWYETLQCIELGYCAGDIRDRYTAIVPQVYVSAPTTLGVIYGVNHERTGKASYHGVALQTTSANHGMGVKAVTSDEMIGSARSFLPNHPLVDDLYAIVLSRDCSRYTELCMEIPTGPCPDIELTQPAKLTVRAYLEPATGTAPLPEEMADDRMLHFREPTP